MGKIYKTNNKIILKYNNTKTAGFFLLLGWRRREINNFSFFQKKPFFHVCSCLRFSNKRKFISLKKFFFSGKITKKKKRRNKPNYKTFSCYQFMQIVRVIITLLDMNTNIISVVWERGEWGHNIIWACLQKGLYRGSHKRLLQLLVNNNEL